LIFNDDMQEVLRFYPSLPIADRVATADCVLPLGEPLKTTTGAKISEIPIRRGQRLYVSIAGYHR
jgi:cytochrome P450